MFCILIGVFSYSKPVDFAQAVEAAKQEGSSAQVACLLAQHSGTQRFASSTRLRLQRALRPAETAEARKMFPNLQPYIRVHAL